MTPLDSASSCSLKKPACPSRTVDRLAIDATVVVEKEESDVACRVPIDIDLIAEVSPGASRPPYTSAHNPAGRRLTLIEQSTRYEMSMRSALTRS